mgnify:CR=1 FL=1
MNLDDLSLVQRIDRLESLDAIRQLAGKYALALDTVSYTHLRAHET